MPLGIIIIIIVIIKCIYKAHFRGCHKCAKNSSNTLNNNVFSLFLNVVRVIEVGLGPGDIVLDWDPAPHGKGHSSPSPHSAHFAHGRPSQQLLSSCQKCVLKIDKQSPGTNV